MPQVRLRYTLTYHGRPTSFGPDAVTIGRSVACNFLVNVEGVSRRHARTEVLDGEVVITDLESANGLFVNGERVDGSQPLSDGDLVVLGEAELRVAISDDDDDAETEALDINQLFVEDENQSAQKQSAGSSLHDNEATGFQDSLALLAKAARRLFEMGDAEGAERTLSPRLLRLLEKAQARRRLDKTQGMRAARLALALALGTDHDKWVTYVRALAVTARGTLKRDLQKLIHRFDKSEARKQSIARRDRSS